MTLKTTRPFSGGNDPVSTARFSSELSVNQMRVKMAYAYGILWAHLLLIAPAYLQANAQSTMESSDNPYGMSSSVAPSTAIIIVVLVSVFTVLAFVSVYLRKCSQAYIEEARAAPPGGSSVANRNRRNGLDPAAIKTFPILSYSAVKGLQTGKCALECAVCLSEFEDGDTLRLLPKCNHVFHPHCIDTWLSSRATCPVCRAKVAAEEEYGLAEESSEASESSDESTQDNSTSRTCEEQNHVVINVEEGQSGGLQAIEFANRSPRGTISGKFPRSHSTGHSLVQPGDLTDRYTLRLPEEVKKQVLECEKLKRCSTSYGAVFARVGSPRVGYRICGKGKIDVEQPAGLSLKFDGGQKNNT